MKVLRCRVKVCGKKISTIDNPPRYNIRNTVSFDNDHTDFNGVDEGGESEHNFVICASCRKELLEKFK